MSPVLWIAAATLVAAIGLWAYLAFSARTKWQSYLGALRAEPGIVVVSADRQDGRFVVSGLRDPLARDPASLVAASGLGADDVAGRWQLYQALDAPIVVTRARQLLQAPDSVRLAFAEGVLTAAGTAPVEWIRESERLAPLVPGVARFDVTDLVDGQVRRLAQELSAAPLLFVRGSTALEAGSEEVLATHLERLRELDELAELGDQRLVVDVTGHADGDGAPDTNDSLSASRAHLIRSAIEQQRLSRIRVEARGVGATQPASQGQAETDKRANRRVTLRLSSQ